LKGITQLIRQNQRPFNFADFQVQQLERINHHLRKLNRTACGELRRVAYVGPSTRYREVGNSLEIIAIQMFSALRFRQGVLIAGRQQQPTLLVIRFGTQCVHCSKNEHGRHVDNRPAACVVLELDHAHEQEIDSLLELARRTEEAVSARCESRGTRPIKFFRGISRLTSAVLRQQRDLHETAFKHPPEIKVEFDDADGPDICMDCHKPMEIDDPMEGHDR